MGLFGFLKKGEYYTLDEIKKKNCKYNIVVSGRSNGKSFDMAKTLIEDFIEFGSRFVLIFRNETSKKTIQKKEAYFKHKGFDVIKYTKGQYSDVFFKGDCYYLGNYEEDSKGSLKKVYGPIIGFIAYISSWEDIKSVQFPNVDNVVLEEFITASGYIFNEVEKLESMLSSILRDRITNKRTRVWFIGNLESRICPYITEWNLRFIFKMNPGEIEVVERNGISIAVERGKERTDKGIYAISKKGQEIETGDWGVGEVPVLKNWQKYDEVYSFIYTFKGFGFKVHCLQEEEGLFILIHPAKKISKGDRVVGDIESTSSLYTKTFQPLSRGEKIVFDLIRQEKVFFSDEMTGSDFWNCIQTQKRGG